MFPHEPQHDAPTEVRNPLTFTDLTVVEEKQTIAKAVIAVATALTTGIGTALADGKGVSVWEIVVGVLGAVVAGASVWAVTNRP